MAWLVAIPALPALAFAVLWPLTRAARTRLRWISLAAVAGSLVLSGVAFAQALAAGGGERVLHHAAARIATVGGTPVEVGIRFDAITAVMLLVVTIVGTCVQVYSIGYMHKDERQGWYFAVLSLFTAAMLVVVLAADYLLLFMAWEVMGLCSYLLIGFWHEQTAPRMASLKAFLTTKVGDLGFVIALGALWASRHSFALAGEGIELTTWVATVVAVGVLAAAAGKSAQVPLHVWLPDAMAGPTPASALIHAATMVAAGVYLVGRSLPVFHLAAPGALTAVLWIGTVTALAAALLAIVQHDIKKILAYSTISQLGYMFMALGAGSEGAAFWHLATHAFFKSLLFLGAGVIIHATRTQDIREMGGLRKSLPWTTAAFLPGALALAGVFPFAGFWSKDEILTVLFEGGHTVPFAIALLTALVTAFYVGRLTFSVFGSSKACSLAREGHPEMLAPMVVLAGITTVVGFASPYFAEFIGEHGAWPDPVMAGTSLTAAVLGLLAAWVVYDRRRVDTEALQRRFAWPYGVLTNKYYADLAVEAGIVRPYAIVCDALSAFDAKVIDGAVHGVAAGWRLATTGTSLFDEGVVDGAVNGIGVLVRSTGAGLRRLQVGRVQSYQRLVFAAVVILLLAVWLFMRGA